MMIRCLDWTGGRILAETVALLESNAGSWALGVDGATAEYVVDDGEPFRFERDGMTVTSTTTRGGIRLDLAYLAAFELVPSGRPDARRALILASRRGAHDACHTVTALGPDRDALVDDARDHLLVDLGVGSTAARFCVRTDDPALLAALDDTEGDPWTDLVDRHGAALLAGAPHRVVETAIGRAEVYTPIPAPGGRSPDGPHTHLLADSLALGGEPDAKHELTAGWVPGATWYPDPPTTGH
jgi:hypothetical protein